MSYLSASSRNNGAASSTTWARTSWPPRDRLAMDLNSCWTFDPDAKRTNHAAQRVNVSTTTLGPQHGQPEGLVSLAMKDLGPIHQMLSALAARRAAIFQEADKSTEELLAISC